MPGIRSFVALEIPQDVRAALATAISGLARTGADIKWVEERNLHLTLKFLGDVEGNRLADLEDALARVAEAQHPFRFDVRGLGAFPSAADPRVIWAGLAQGSRECGALWRAVEDECSRAGFARERRGFTPHLTIGRQRSGYGAAAIGEAIGRELGREFGSAAVSEMILFRSDLRPSGPIYTPQATFAFGATASR